MSDMNQPGHRDGIEGDEPPPDADATSDEGDTESTPVMPIVPPPD